MSNYFLNSIFDHFHTFFMVIYIILSKVLERLPLHPIPDVTASTLLGRLSTRFRSVFVEIFDHSWAAVGHVVCLQTPVPPDQVLRCPWARHLTPAAPGELDGALNGRCMSAWEAKCKVLWWPLGMWKCYINAVNLPFF